MDSRVGLIFWGLVNQVSSFSNSAVQKQQNVPLGVVDMKRRVAAIANLADVVRARLRVAEATGEMRISPGQPIWVIISTDATSEQGCA